jgi:phage/plasmid primase-like uncharacterized protein
VQLRRAISDAGYSPPGELHLDGILHRFPVKERRGGVADDSGWYIAWGDGVPAGSFGSWSDGKKYTWAADMGRPVTAAESLQHAARQAEAQKARAAEAKRRADSAAAVARTIWDAAKPAPVDHPYLVQKLIRPHLARVTTDGRLVLPMEDDGGRLLSLQFIDPPSARGGLGTGAGAKKFLPNGRTKGARAVLGDLAGDGPVGIAEGFATAASVREATGWPCVVAYSANNLAPVAADLRRSYAQREIVIVADNDESGVGIKAADAAAEATGARVVLPPIAGQDANDYAVAGHDLAALLLPPAPAAPAAWLTPLSGFAAAPAPIRWLVRRWIPRECLAMVHGPSGGGKTFLVLDLALTLAAGFDSWQGQTVHPCAIAYLAGEGHHGLRARVAAWCQSRGVDPSTLQGAVSGSACDLNEPTALRATIANLHTLPVRPELIIVDTLHRFLVGDENSAETARTMLDACAMLQREFAATVILVHHTGVAEEAQRRARGSSAWKGALDIEISVAPGSGDRPITVSQLKAKDAEPAQPLHFALSQVTIDGWQDEDGEPVTSCVLEAADAPAPRRKAGPLERHQKTIERAWWASGTEVDEEGRPYISRAALRHFLEVNDGLTEQAALAAVKPGAKDRLVGFLLNADTLMAHGAGWSVVGSEMATGLLLAAGSKGGLE